VYKLATFCRAHKNDLDQRLVLLSLSWPSVGYPFKSAEPTDEELNPIRTFDCNNARCFKPSDCAAVKEAIRKEWQSEDAFNFSLCELSCQTSLLRASNSTAAFCSAT
jgi:hypothetical protein